MRQGRKNGMIPFISFVAQLRISCLSQFCKMNQRSSLVGWIYRPSHICTDNQKNSFPRKRRSSSPFRWLRNMARTMRRSQRLRSVMPLHFMRRAGWMRFSRHLKPCFHQQSPDFMRHSHQHIKEPLINSFFHCEPPQIMMFVRAYIWTLFRYQTNCNTNSFLCNIFWYRSNYLFLYPLTKEFLSWPLLRFVFAGKSSLEQSGKGLFPPFFSGKFYFCSVSSTVKFFLCRD